MDGIKYKVSRPVNFDVEAQTEIKYDIDNPRDIIVVGHTGGITYFHIMLAILATLTGILILCGKLDHVIKVRGDNFPTS